jgi:hypothetical protein
VRRYDERQREKERAFTGVATHAVEGRLIGEDDMRERKR